MYSESIWNLNELRKHPIGPAEGGWLPLSGFGETLWCDLKPGAFIYCNRSLLELLMSTYETNRRVPLPLSDPEIEPAVLILLATSLMCDPGFTFWISPLV